MKKVLILLMLGVTLTLGLYAQTPTGDTVDVTFTYSPGRREAQTLKEVTLAGSFNNWDAFATPLAKNADGIWSVTVKLSPQRKLDSKHGNHRG
jgi:1,4-alpha-glucan branching enzyme